MRGVLVPLAVALWVLGAAGLVWLGWTPDAPTWRLVVTGAAAVAVVAGITAALTRSRPEPNVVAVLSCVALAAALPAPVTGLGDILGLVLATAAVLAGYYTLQLSLRTHAVAGPVLKHGMMRIAGTVAAAALVAVLAIAGMRVLVGSASARMEASLDVDSGLFLAPGAALLMAVITALSMLMVARAHPDVGKGSDDKSVAESTRSQGDR